MKQKEELVVSARLSFSKFLYESQLSRGEAGFSFIFKKKPLEVNLAGADGTLSPF
jgi:hypothetical protein